MRGYAVQRSRTMNIYGEPILIALQDSAMREFVYESLCRFGLCNCTVVENEMAAFSCIWAGIAESPCAPYTMVIGDDPRAGNTTLDLPQILQYHRLFRNIGIILLTDHERKPGSRDYRMLVEYLPVTLTFSQLVSSVYSVWRKLQLFREGDYVH